MIARLSGTLIESSFTSCVVDCGGVGYEVQIPVSTFDKLPQPGEQVVLKIHTAVREDAITLFGFASEEERKLFRLLIEVSGIGGKLALNVLSSTAVTTFCAAVGASDVKALSRINGIGKRRLLICIFIRIFKGFACESLQTRKGLKMRLKRDEKVALGAGSEIRQYLADPCLALSCGHDSTARESILDMKILNIFAQKQSAYYCDDCKNSGNY